MEQSAEYPNVAIEREQKSLNQFIEAGANLEHERWSGWQKYLHSLCTANDDGSLTISPERVKHWQRQIDTPYSELSEREKEYDRKEVRKYLPLIAKWDSMQTDLDALDK